jgi:hypothetical protein
MTNPLITIEVTLTPHKGKSSGYQFRYTSNSGLVALDGRIDLSNFPHDDVDIEFRLMPMATGQPTFPTQSGDAIWFVKWPKHLPPPVPCPKSAGHSGSPFHGFSHPAANRLRFTNKNMDNKRYSYALRCIVNPGKPEVVDDPVIINKISQA